MNFRCSATMKSGAGELRCDRMRGHAGAHAANDHEEQHAYVWYWAPEEIEAKRGATLEELLAHLRDLAELASSERFTLLGSFLLQKHEIIKRSGHVFDRDTELPPAASPQTPR